jgi:hypothetical protein
MVSQGGHGLFRSRSTVRVGRWPHRGIADRRRIKREQRVFAQAHVIQRGQFHEEVVGMLAIDDGTAESGLALLKQQRIEALGRRGRLQAEHCADRQLTGAYLSLRHGHEPVGGKEFVSAARSALLDTIQEDCAVEHEHPVALRPHDHLTGS